MLSNKLFGVIRKNLKFVNNIRHFHATSMSATTIISVRKDGDVAVVGDGQVSLGSTIVKPNARKVRRLTLPKDNISTSSEKKKKMKVIKIIILMILLLVLQVVQLMHLHYLID